MRTLMLLLLLALSLPAQLAANIEYVGPYGNWNQTQGWGSKVRASDFRMALAWNNAGHHVSVHVSALIVDNVSGVQPFQPITISWGWPTSTLHTPTFSVPDYGHGGSILLFAQVDWFGRNNTMIWQAFGTDLLRYR